MKRWSEAMTEALYGPAGFFRRTSPAEHFRTSVHTGPVFVDAIVRLLAEVDSALGHPDRIDLVDVGAGRGELLAAIHERDPAPGRSRLTAVEIADRPPGLTEAIEWRTSRPGEPANIPDGVVGLLIATEWLDNVPLDVGVPDRYLLVGDEIGEPLDEPDAAWVRDWWPDGVRIEIGRTRDEAWAGAVAHIERGLAVAIDYGHLADRRPPLGTLTGYRNGRAVEPVPDGDSDLTAHIAVDSVAAAGSVVAGLPASVVRQSEALRVLGVSGRRPDLALAHRDPAGYVRALAAASLAAELTDEASLGGHFWIQQPVAIRWPA